MIDKDLNDVLKRGNGIALIVSMVECPECAKDIWVEMGSHDEEFITKHKEEASKSNGTDKYLTEICWDLN